MLYCAIINYGALLCCDKRCRFICRDKWVELYCAVMNTSAFCLRRQFWSRQILDVMELNWHYFAEQLLTWPILPVLDLHTRPEWWEAMLCFCKVKFPYSFVLGLLLRWYCTPMQNHYLHDSDFCQFFSDLMADKIKNPPSTV